MAQAREREAIVRGNGEVRGTQTFVGVMVMVWRRPVWTLLEVAWRWVFGVCALALIAAALRDAAARVGRGGLPGGFDPRRLTLMDPLGSSQRLADAVAAFLPELARWWWVLPVLAFFWVAAATVGRTAVARRFDASLRPAYAAAAVLYALRLAAFGALGGLWAALLYADAHITIARPILQGAEPNLVLYFALAVIATLLLFVAWSGLSWVLRLAPLLAMADGVNAVQAVREAIGSRNARGKLVEINLVMGIVKIALVVLLMVFSATPLPFESFTTQGFLWGWWTAMTLVYLVLSDYFHVVHAASFLWLWKDLQGK